MNNMISKDDLMSKYIFLDTVSPHFLKHMKPLYLQT